MTDSQKKQDWMDKLTDLWWGKLIGALLMAFMAWYLFGEFTKLETGEIESARVWAPAAALYKVGGKWGGISLFVLIGGFLVGNGIWQFVTERSKKPKPAQRTQSRPAKRQAAPRLVLGQSD